MKSIRRIRSLEGKRVLVRVDFNVPVKRGRVLDDARLSASLPTIRYLAEKKAAVILVTHLGRPEGRVVAKMKVDPIIDRLSELLRKRVEKLETKNWRLTDKKKLELIKQVENLNPGQVVMMENIRFSPDEKNDTGVLSQELANLADLFVLDGFAVAHRASASVIGAARYLPSYAGFLLEKEIKNLKKITERPKPPFVAVLGGAKIATKIPVIKNLLPKADNILVGGGILNTYLKAVGYKIGDSLVDEKFKKEALAYCKKRKVILPVDVVVGTSQGTHFRVVEIGGKPRKICGKGEGVFDIGPQTIRVFAGYIKKAQTLVWNGAMGYFERKPYDVGTLSVARLIASRSKGKAYGVIGGGETLQAMDIAGMSEDIDFISTGGGAMLEFLAGSKIPGVAVLSRGKIKKSLKRR